MQQRETGAGGLFELRANCWKGSDRDVEGSRDGSHPVMWARKLKLWLDTLYITADRIITHPKLPRNHFYLPKSICSLTSLIKRQLLQIWLLQLCRSWRPNRRSAPNSCAKTALSDSCRSDHFGEKNNVFFKKNRPRYAVLVKNFNADMHSVPFLSE